MNIKLTEITTDVEIHVPTLKKRATESSRTPHTKHFIATDQNKEIAFVSIDQRPKVDYLVLYEIYVEPNLRKNGYGKETILAVEKLAKGLNYKKVFIRPEPFDRTITKEQLIIWYENQGYKVAEHCDQELEKAI